MMPLKSPTLSSCHHINPSNTKSNKPHTPQEDLKKNSSTSSTWSTKSTWWTPAFIITSYVAAFIIALAHLMLFKYLDGGISEGPSQRAPQKYINTASQLLANSFQICLQTSLGASFVQYLWLTLSRSTLRISTIDSLFLIRSEPFSFKWSALQAAPQLVCLTILIWAIYIAAIFPPGALTISVGSHMINSFRPVPTFNASYMGNGSCADAKIFSFESIGQGSVGTLGPEGYSYVSSISYTAFATGFSPYLQHLANIIIVSGESSAISSPCGPDCSYETVFDGPYLSCNTSATPVVVNQRTLPSTIYNGAYLIAGPSQDLPKWGHNYSSMFLATSWSPTAKSDSSTILTQQHITCFPYRAQYTLSNTYRNGVQNLNVSIVPMEPIVSFNSANIQRIVQILANISNSPTTGSEISPTVPINWTNVGLNRYRDLNLLNIIGVLGHSLAGAYISDSPFSITNLDTTLPGYGNVLWSLDNVWNGLTGPNYYGRVLGPIGGTNIAESKLNDFIRIPSKQLSYPGVRFTIDQDLLNELLKNITISAITRFGFWDTTANVTMNVSVSTYKFSSPINLIFPYFLSLFFALPFVLSGLWALKTNGFSANDRGFIQLLATARSMSLERAAAAGSLGATPSQLKDLKIRFGELIDHQGTDQRHRDFKRDKIAGFGTEQETIPLKRGARYGRRRSFGSNV